VKVPAVEKALVDSDRAVANALTHGPARHHPLRAAVESGQDFQRSVKQLPYGGRVRDERGDEWTISASSTAATVSRSWCC
jgi:hypothetical protein